MPVQTAIQLGHDYCLKNFMKGVHFAYAVRKAVDKGLPDSVEFLLTAVADVNHKDEHGGTLLMSRHGQRAL